ncbi:MAG: hypothetical protein NTY42_11325 [Planctomycetota bacterium]|nr:hypothetical protein [Planctomycetota bacterium]
MTLELTTFSILVSCIGVAVTIVLGWTAWKRNDYHWKSGVLEILRFGLVCLAIITLLKPEYVTVERPTTEGTVLFLHDASASMQTEDESDSTGYHSRQTQLEPWLDKDKWTGVPLSTTIAKEPFDSSEYASKGTDIQEALMRAVERYPDLQSIVLASDGDWNLGGNPIEAAKVLRQREIPVHAVLVGSEQRMPDLAIQSFELPTFAVVGKPLRVPFSISSSLAQDTDATIQLEIPDGTKLSQTIRVPAMAIAKGTFEWRPDKVGEESITIQIQHDPRDRIASNDSKRVAISFRSESLKVLMLESFPRWEYRYTRNALERDPGVEVHCYLLHPDIKELGDGRGYLQAFPQDEALFAYDVVFLGDIGMGPDELTESQCQQLRRLVQSQASGLVFMPGMRGRQSSLLNSPLEELFPVDLETARPRGVGASKPGQFQLTEQGHQSLLTRFEYNEQENEQVWRSLPGFYWYASVERARAGSQILATHERDSNRFGRIPLIVTKTFGNGKVLFMGSDGAWRWRKGVEDKYHYRFWGQVVRWMAYQRSMATGESMRLFHAPDRPNEGDVVTLQANIMGSNGEPLEDGTVTTSVVDPNGKMEIVSLKRDDPQAWGLFRGEFKPKMGGEFQLTTHCKQTGKTLESTLYIQSTEREQIGKPARPDVLRDIANATRGKFTSISDIEDVLKVATIAREPQPVERRLQLWSHPLWGAAILFLLGLFWAGRKWMGFV